VRGAQVGRLGQRIDWGFVGVGFRFVEWIRLRWLIVVEQRIDGVRRIGRRIGRRKQGRRPLTPVAPLRVRARRI
ncbi:MAG TPA: hypothetical protein VFC16_18120, partial [Nakamurella sp.]|nr:hypothetical protein [Nakamurella sp.]